jgi:ParB family chromosome partitioning protein
MNTKEPRKVLGRGISSLIPSAPKPQVVTQPVTTAPVAATVAPTDTASRGNEKALLVEIDRIRTNPRQPRKVFKEQALAELTQSVREKGVLQPILVCRKGMHYELIAGERRFRASQQAGLKFIPVRILETNDQEQLEIALIENLMREDLNPIEEAKGYDKLQKEFKLTHEQISQKVSKDRTTITNILRLLKLPLTVQQDVQFGKISMGHARALLSLEREQQQTELAAKVVSQGLSVRQTEKLAAELIKPKKEVPVQRTNPNLQFVKEEIQRKLGTKMEIKEKSPQRGEIRIQYFSQEDLHRIISVLKNG